MTGTFIKGTTLVVLLALVSKGSCQMAGMFGGMGSGMSQLMQSMGSMGSTGGMFGGGMNSSPFGSMGGPMAMAAMGTMGSGMSSVMMGGMMGMNPLMSLVMSSIELSPSELMMLTNFVKSIVGPQGYANAALMALYSSEGGLPINAVKMIPWITIMQCQAKDLNIRIPGVRGKATRKQIDNFVFRNALHYMQSRNMAGAFLENPAMLMMGNRLGFNFGPPSLTPMSPPSPRMSAPSPPASPSAAVNSASATAKATASAQAAIAKFLASQKGAKTASGPVIPPKPAPVKPTTAPAKSTASGPKPPPGLTATQKALFKAFMASKGAKAPAPASPSLPAGLTLPSSLTQGLNLPGGSSGLSGANSGLNAMGLTAGAELMGF